MRVWPSARLCSAAPPERTLHGGVLAPVRPPLRGACCGRKGLRRHRGGAAADTSAGLPVRARILPIRSGTSPVTWCGWPGWRVGYAWVPGFHARSVGPTAVICGLPLGSPWSRGPLHPFYRRPASSGTPGYASLLLGGIMTKQPAAADGPPARPAPRWRLPRPARLRPAPASAASTATGCAGSGAPDG